MKVFISPPPAPSLTCSSYVVSITNSLHTSNFYSHFLTVLSPPPGPLLQALLQGFPLLSQLSPLHLSPQLSLSSQLEAFRSFSLATPQQVRFLAPTMAIFLPVAAVGIAQAVAMAGNPLTRRRPGPPQSSGPFPSVLHRWSFLHRQCPLPAQKGSFPPSWVRVEGHIKGFPLALRVSGKPLLVKMRRVGGEALPPHSRHIFLILCVLNRTLDCLLVQPPGRAAEDTAAPPW